MKKLIWKELMEQRLIPVAYAALGVLVLAMWYAFDAQSSKAIDRLDVDSCGMVLIASILFSGLLPGSNSVSSESKSGTLQFLALLPAGKKKIWLGKVTAGLLTTFSSVALSALCLSLLTVKLFGLAAYSDMLDRFLTVDDNTGLTVLLMGSAVLVIYFISTLMSTLVESTLAATVLALVVSITWGVIAISSQNAVAGHVRLPWMILCILLTASLGGFITSAYVTFCKGETLRTRKRFWLAGSTALCWLVCGAATMAADAKLLWLTPHKMEASTAAFTFQPGHYDFHQLDIGRKFEYGQAFLVHAKVNGPIKAKTSTPNLKVTSIHLWGDYTDQYEVRFTYTPEYPGGADHQMIELFTSDKISMGKIVVEGFKTIPAHLHRPVKPLATYRNTSALIGQSYTETIPLGTTPLSPALKKPLVAFADNDPAGENQTASVVSAGPDHPIPFVKFTYKPQGLPGYYQYAIHIFTKSGDFVGYVPIIAHKVSNIPPRSTAILMTYDCGRIKLGTSTRLDVPLTKRCSKLHVTQASVDTPYPLSWLYPDGEPQKLSCDYYAVRGTATETPVMLFNDSNEEVGQVIVKAEEYK